MHVPLVPPAAFRSLTGEALAGQLSELLMQKELTEIVLFSDATGEQLALLCIGPGRHFEKLADAAGVEIDGLRALCALRPGDSTMAGSAAGAREKELAQLEESLNARERYIAECEQRIAEVGQNLSEREALLEQREQQLLAKERDFFRRSGDLTRQNGDTVPGKSS